jgi:hypothetical protein
MARKIPAEHLAAYTIQRNGFTSVSRRNAVWSRGTTHPQWFKERLPRANHRIAAECEMQYVTHAANMRRQFAHTPANQVTARDSFKKEHAWAIAGARLMRQDMQRQVAKLRELR